MFTWRHANLNNEVSRTTKLEKTMSKQNRLHSGRYGLLNNITKFELKFAPTPDHKALQINVEIHTATRGPSYWKMNISVLDEIAYQDAIKKLIRNEIDKGIMNNQSNMLVWDLIKVKIREFTQSYCMTRSHRKKNRILILEDKLKDIYYYCKKMISLI